MKNPILIIASLTLTLIISCGKENQTSTNGGGVFKVRVTIDPPLQPGLNSGAYNSIGISVSTTTKSWTGIQQTKQLSTIETDEISVTKGQNIQFTISSFLNNYDRICRTIKYEAIQNGKVNETHIASLGIDNSGMICADGLMINKNFIIK